MSDERDPNGYDLKTPVAKADDVKSPLLRGCLLYFPRALLEISRVSQKGAEKYSWKGWESVPDGSNRYGDALSRHLVYESIEGIYDRDTGLLHASQVAWNALARLELLLRDMEESSSKLKYKQTNYGYNIVIQDEEMTIKKIEDVT